MKEDLFRPVFLKLNRSQFHINDISSILKNSWDESKIKFTTKISEDKLGYEIYTNDFSNDNFLEELGVRIGEIANNLGTALDNLIFSTARSVCDPPLKPNKLYFPIFENESEFHNKTKDIFNQIPEEVKEFIISVQPFIMKKHNENFNSDFYVLSILHWLNNTDKHRTPKVLLAILDQIEFKGSFEFDNEDFTNIINEQEGFFNFFPIIPNSKVFEFRTTETIVNMNMDFDLKIEVVLEIFEKNVKIEILQILQNNIFTLILEYLKKINVNFEIENRH